MVLLRTKVIKTDGNDDRTRTTDGVTTSDKANRAFYIKNLYFKGCVTALNEGCLAN